MLGDSPGSQDVRVCRARPAGPLIRPPGDDPDRQAPASAATIPAGRRDCRLPPVRSTASRHPALCPASRRRTITTACANGGATRMCWSPKTIRRCGHDGRAAERPFGHSARRRRNRAKRGGRHAAARFDPILMDNQRAATRPGGHRPDLRAAYLADTTPIIALWRTGRRMAKPARRVGMNGHG